MKWIRLIILALLVLMSLAAGAAKIMQIPQEVGFFESAGLAKSAVLPFGIVQILGAALAVMPKTRKIGIMVMALIFLASALMVFITGNIGFGLVSLLPVVVATSLLVAKRQIT